jgi:hypothetical protein
MRKGWFSLAIIFALGLAVWPLFVPPSAGQAPPAVTAMRSTVDRILPSSDDSFDTKSYSTRNYEEAWELLDDPNSVMAQNLIAEWSKVDFQKAVRALMNRRGNLPGYRRIPSSLIAENQSWLMTKIDQREFGLQSQKLIDMLVRAREELLAETRWKLVEIANRRGQGDLLKSFFDDPATREKNFAQTSFLSTPWTRRLARSAYARALAEDKDSAAILAAAQQQQNAEARADLAASWVDEKSLPEFLKDLPEMTTDVYQDVLKAAAQRLPANHPPDNLLETLRTFQESEHWQAFEFVDYEPWIYDHPNVRDWAMSLPANEKAAPAVRGTVRALFIQDLQRGREWLTDLPSGWHREVALEEFTNIAASNGNQAAENWARSEQGQ